MKIKNIKNPATRRCVRNDMRERKSISSSTGKQGNCYYCGEEGIIGDSLTMISDGRCYCSHSCL